MAHQIQIDFAPGDAVYSDIGTADRGPTVWRIDKVEIVDNLLTVLYACRNTDTGEIEMVPGGFYSFQEMCEMRGEAGYNAPS